jgi:3-methyl-2-oxobutanoate hydroxymethyltransferase
MNIFEFKNRKIEKKRLSLVTCYDYTSARLVSTTNVDALLVGDSLAMTMLGHTSTLPVSVETMALFTAAVIRGAGDKFVIADLPFLSYRKSLSENVAAAAALMQAGAHAVKLEGAAGNCELIRHLVDSGVPVMGHIGLTPQSINQLGGYRVQGREAVAAQKLIQAAHDLEKAGCFSIVLECVPSPLARKISQELQIPTIGIGAGPDTDGQILVWQDLLGLNTDFKPKFVRTYLDGAASIQNAVNKYVEDVGNGGFPNEKESYE